MNLKQENFEGRLCDKFTINNNVVKNVLHKDAVSAEFLLFRRRIETRFWWEMAIHPNKIQ